MQYEKFNDKYHLLRKDINPNSLFSSFRVFKVLGTGSILKADQRPPYPIITDSPSIAEVFENVNKSDVLVGLTFVAAGFCASILVTRSHMHLHSKFMITKYMMGWYSLLGAFMAMNCSYYRLTGFMENGLRWKTKDLLYQKYDFTSDFERNTIFGLFRERID